MSFIVSEQWLNNRLENNSEDTIIIDARFQMDGSGAGKQAYLESHIPSAIYLDLDKDLSSEAKKHGGNHPLPDVEVFSEKLGAIGINQDKTVVIYDQQDSLFASRAWWLFHYLGHKKVYVLDGGFKGWVEAGNKVSAEVIKHTPVVFTPNVLKDVIVNMEEVKTKTEDRSSTIIDSRLKDRYLGKEENMHAKAGHIPSSKSFFWKNVLHEDGTWKSKEELEANFASLSKDDEIIVSCGSGVSACPNVIGLKMAGFKHIKLYPGSFSDWISYEDNEIETKEA